MIKRLLKSVREFKKDALLTPFFVVLEVVMEVIIPLVMALLIDKGIDGQDMAAIWKYGIILVLCAMLALVFGAAAGTFAARASTGFARNLRHDMYYNVQNFSFSNIDKFSTGSIVTRLTTDVTNVQNAFQMCTRIAVRCPVMLVFALFMAMKINSRMALVFLAVLPILAIGMGILMKVVGPVFERAFKIYDRMNTVVQENVRGIRVVKTYVREDHETEKFEGVSGMLYLNFGIDDPGQKKFNKYGTEEDLDASAFIRQVNCAVEAHYPDVMMMAEESTAWPLVTYPPQDGGLGFHYKWDMGWMNDTLHYMQTDFPWRPGNHGLLTFSIMYAFTENFICPLSHDEVVHGKCSLIGRMPGDWWRQFAGLRTLAFYQMTHPGAKLNFMGNEIGQFIEWRYYESIQWFLTEQYETHAHHQAFIKALNHLYTAEPALYERGYNDDGFTWIDADNSKQSIVSFVRQGENVDDDLVILINFDPAAYESFRVGVPREGDWEVIFDSDRPEFGGSGYAGEEPYTCSSEPYPWNGQMDSIEIKVPSLAGVVLKRRGPSSYKPPVVEEPKKATRKRASSVKPKPAAAKKAPAKAKATATKAKAKAATKPAAKATATKKPAAKKAATKAKSASVKSSSKNA